MLKDCSVDTIAKHIKALKAEYDKIQFREIEPRTIHKLITQIITEYTELVEANRFKGLIVMNSFKKAEQELFKEINALKSYLDELDSLELEQFRKELDELFKEASDELKKEKQALMFEKVAIEYLEELEGKSFEHVVTKDEKSYIYKVSLEIEEKPKRKDNQ